MKLNSIVWDFDGTLIDTDSAIVAAFLGVLQSNYGITESVSRVEQLVKVDPKHCAMALSAEYSLQYASLLAQARSAYNDIGMEQQRPFDGAQSCCEKAIALGGKNVLVTHRDRLSCMRFLSHYGFEAYFSHIVTSDDGFPLKPSPESFKHVIVANQLDIKATCGVGDREIDVAAANAAGIISFYFCPKDTSNKNANYSISALIELERALETGYMGSPV